MGSDVVPDFPRHVEHPLIARRPIDAATRILHVVNLRGPDDLTDTVKEWLAESYALIRVTPPRPPALSAFAPTER